MAQCVNMLCNEVGDRHFKSNYDNVIVFISLFWLHMRSTAVHLSLFQLHLFKKLTHWGRVMHICIDNLSHHCFRWWLVAWSAPCHYLNQCWDIINWTLRNKLQWNFNRNSNIFIQEKAFGSVVCEMAAILSQPQWVNYRYAGYTHLTHQVEPVLLRKINVKMHIIGQGVFTMASDWLAAHCQPIKRQVWESLPSGPIMALYLGSVFLGEIQLSKCMFVNEDA